MDAGPALGPRIARDPLAYVDSAVGETLAASWRRLAIADQAYEGGSRHARKPVETEPVARPKDRVARVRGVDHRNARRGRPQPELRRPLLPGECHHLR